MFNPSNNRPSLIRVPILCATIVVAITLFAFLLPPTSKEQGRSSEGVAVTSRSVSIGAEDHATEEEHTEARVEPSTHEPDVPGLWVELGSELDKLSAAADREAAAAELAGWFREHLVEDSDVLGDWFAKRLQGQDRFNESEFDRGYRMMGFQIFLTEWGSMDGEQAIAYVQALSAQKVIPEAHDQRVIEGWIRDDPGAALAFLWRVPESVDRRSIDTMGRRLSYFSDSVWRDSPEGYLQWIRELVPDGEGSDGTMDPRVQVSLERMGALANGRHFEAAGDLLLQYEGALDYRSVLRPFAKRYANTRPVEALDWALGSASGDNAEMLVNDVFRAVARNDPETGIELLNGPFSSQITAQLSMSAVDGVRSQFILNTVDHHGADRDTLLMVLASLNTIGDETIRLETTRHVEDTIIRFHTAEAIPEFYAALARKPPAFRKLQ